MSTIKWIVVGGGDKGGIVVRTEKATSSPQADSRLSTGALVKQLRLEGERLQYEVVCGTGPSEGWVSTKLKDKDLLVRASKLKFEVVVDPRMFLRETPEAQGKVAGSLNKGETVEALEWSSDDKWIRIDENKWAMLAHPEKGQLLKLVPNSQGQEEAAQAGSEPQTLKKKSWDVEFKFKGCGANVTGLAGGTGGASRDQLFEFLSLQHLQIQLRKEFVTNTLPLYMYDTGVADEADCVACFQTAGHLMVEEEPGRKAKPSPGGVRQYVKFLGGLRCIIAHKEGHKPSALVVLAHGYRVLGDDLYGLADYLAKPGFLFVLPQAPHECEMEDIPEEEEWRRVPLQWWLPPRKGDPTKELTAAGTQLAECVKESLDLAGPDVRLLLGGFSQGAAVALTAALTGSKIIGKPANALILLSAAAPSEPFPLSSLADATVLVSAGSEDEIHPASGCEKLLEACKKAGAAAEPMLRYSGGHEVTTDVAKAISTFITKIAKV